MTEEADSDPSPRWSSFFATEHLIPIMLIMVAVLLHAADATLIATLSPAIVRDIGGLALLPWGFALYETGSIVAAASSALLALRYGLGAPMAVASLLFGFGCLVSALAPAMWILLLGRCLQGMGGGCLVALSFVSVTTLFPLSLMPKALALVSAVWGLSAFLGPLVGGIFVEISSWRIAFVFFAILALLVSMASVKSLSKYQIELKQTATRVPVRRLCLLALGVLLIASAGVVAGTAQVPLLFCSGLIALFGFFWLDTQSGETRMLAAQSINFRTPVGAGLLMILLFACATMTLSVYGPLLLTEFHQVSMLVAGYVIASSSFGWSIAAVATSSIPERLDRFMIGSGMVVLLVSTLGLLYWLPRGPVWVIAIIALLEGAGFGLSWAFILRRLTRLVDVSDRERIASAIATIHRLGYAIGAAVMGIVANKAGMQLGHPDKLTTTSNWLFVVSSGIALAGLFATWRFLNTGHHRPENTAQ